MPLRTDLVSLFLAIPSCLMALAPRSAPVLPENILFVETTEKMNCRIVSGDYAFELDPSDGGRIVAFSFQGRNIMLTAGESPAYGTSVWPSPQSAWGWPPPPELDKNPWHIIPHPRSLVLESGTNRKLGLSVRQSITPDLEQGKISIEYEFFNRGSRPLKVAAWQNMRVHPCGLTFYPASRPTYDYKYNTLVLEPRDGIVWFKHDPLDFDGNKKSFQDGEEGWLAHLAGRLLLVKIFDDVAPENQAPEEAEIEIYVDGEGKFVEVETQGAYTEIKPKRSLKRKILWILRPLPDGVPSEAGSEELAATVRALVREAR